MTIIFIVLTAISPATLSHLDHQRRHTHTHTPTPRPLLLRMQPAGVHCGQQDPWKDVVKAGGGEALFKVEVEREREPFIFPTQQQLKKQN